jgi:hypothetical protein
MSNESVHEIRNRVAPVFHINGTEVPSPQFGEEPERYHHRVLSCAQGLLPPDHVWSGIPLARQPLATVERALVHDRIEAFKAPVGPLRSLTERDRTGREIIHWYGSPEECWKPFKQEPRRAIFTPGMGRGENSVQAKAAAAAARHEQGLAFAALALA